MGGGGKKGGNKQTTEMRIDPRTQQYVESNRRQAVDSADSIVNNPGSFYAGVNPLTGEAVDAARTAMGQGADIFGLGQGAFASGAGMAGGTAAQGMANWMSPYQDQVIGGIRGQADYQRNIAEQGAQQLATQAGAFGGSREAVLRAERMAPIDRDEASNVANFLDQGYGRAQQGALSDASRGLGLAQLGLGGMGAGAGMGMAAGGQLGAYGDYMRNVENQRLQEPIMRANAAQNLRNTSIGPYGQTQTQQMPSNKFGSGLGGAATMAGITSNPWAIGAAGAGGLLFG